MFQLHGFYFGGGLLAVSFLAYDMAFWVSGSKPQHVSR